MSDAEALDGDFTIDIDVGLLIKLVHNFPYLYNNQLPEFKNMNLRERTWIKIANTLKVPVVDCQRVWRNLRDKYGKEKRLSLEHPETDSKWEFYKSMHFLQPFVKQRKRRKRIHRNYQPAIDYKESTGDLSNSSTSTDKKIWQPIDVSFSPEDITILDNEFEENDGETEEIIMKQDEEDLSLRLVDEQEDTVSIVRHQSSEEAFGAYVASRLMDFAVDDRKAKKVKIFKILEDLDELS